MHLQPRLFIVIVCVMINTGCMVVAIERNATRRIDNPPLTIERARLDCDELDKTPVSTTPLRGVTKQQLKAAWGVPDKVEIVNKMERWYYKANLRWNGFWGIFVVVPVPLIVPTGREKMIVEFSDDLVQSVEVHYQVGQELGCGFVLIHGGGWSCSDGKPNHYYGLHSSFCGYEKRFDQSSEPN